MRHELTTAITIGLVALAAGVGAMWSGPYTVYMVALFAAYTVGAIGYNLVLGSAGQMAFGHAGFLACGAYVFGVLRMNGLPFLIAAPSAVAATTALGFLIGLLTARVQHFYLALITLACAEAVVFGIGLWPDAGGSDGLLISGPPPETLVVLAMPAAALVTILVRNVVRTRVGRGLRMMRDDPVAAQAFGLPLGRTRLVVFTFGAMLGGVSGIMIALALGFISPVAFGVSETLKLLTMIVIGGFGSVWGAVAGAAIVTVLPEVLSLSPLAQDLTFGVVVFVVLVVTPGGLAEGVTRLYRRFAHGWAHPVSSTVSGPAPAASAVTVTGGVDAPVGLRLTDVTVRFGGLVALDSATVHVAPGTVHALIGPNGAGKTTLINAVMGDVDATGRIQAGERDLLPLPPHARAEIGITRTFQHSALFDSLTVEENVMAGGYHRDGHGAVAPMLGLPAVWRTERADRDRARQLLDLVGLSGRGDVHPGELPGGQRRMVGLARALAARPRVLLADELAAGMNDEELDAVAELLRRLNVETGLTILIIEHHLEFVAAVATHASALDSGRVVMTGPTREVLTDDRVVESYVGR